MPTTGLASATFASGAVEPAAPAPGTGQSTETVHSTEVLEISGDLKRALILCTGNSCRSQMAEALWKALGEGEWEAHSAGSNPAGYVHPLAIESMREYGIDLSAARSKHLQEYINWSFDVVVTVCGNAKESCPVFSGAHKTLHWPFPDPAHAQGTDEEKMIAFRYVRDQIRSRISTYLKTGE